MGFSFTGNLFEKVVLIMSLYLECLQLGSSLAILSQGLLTWAIFAAIDLILLLKDVKKSTSYKCPDESS